MESFKLRPISIGMVLAVICSGCAASRSEYIPITQTGLTPALEQEKAKITAETLKLQADLTEKHAFIEDPRLQAFLDQMVRKISNAAEIPPDKICRVRILREPTVNAAALITGEIYLHAGLLAHTHDESELAFVLAHEISHYYNQDILYFVDSLKRKTVTYKILDVLITPPAVMVGAGGLSGTTLGLIYAGSVMGYSRENEAAADVFALEKMARAGYDPQKGLTFFDLLLSEKEKYQQGIEIFFLSSHPSNQWRREKTNEWLKSHGPTLEVSAAVSEKGVAVAGYDDLIYPVLRENARMNYQLGRYFHAFENIERAKAIRPKDSEIHYIEGETYRLLAENPFRVRDELSKKEWKKINETEEAERIKRWRAAAKQAYEASIAADAAYPMSYQGMGIILFGQNDYQNARKYFEKYLALNPMAKDRRFVLRYLSDIADSTMKVGAS